MEGRGKADHAAGVVEIGAAAVGDVHQAVAVAHPRGVARNRMRGEGSRLPGRQSENAASLRVVEKLGFTEIGYAPRFLHIDGAWRDHRIFAITVEEVGPGLLSRLSS